jgi:hypothetical protein
VCTGRGGWRWWWRAEVGTALLALSARRGRGAMRGRSAMRARSCCGGATVVGVVRPRGSARAGDSGPNRCPSDVEGRLNRDYRGSVVPRCLEAGIRAESPARPGTAARAPRAPDASGARARGSSSGGVSGTGAAPVRSWVLRASTCLRETEGSGPKRRPGRVDRHNTRQLDHNPHFGPEPPAPGRQRTTHGTPRRQQHPLLTAPEPRLAPSTNARAERHRQRDVEQRTRTTPAKHEGQGRRPPDHLRVGSVGHEGVHGPRRLEVVLAGCGVAARGGQFGAEPAACDVEGRLNHAYGGSVVPRWLEAGIRRRIAHPGHRGTTCGY